LFTRRDGVFLHLSVFLHPADSTGSSRSWPALLAAFERWLAGVDQETAPATASHPNSDLDSLQPGNFLDTCQWLLDFPGIELTT
jgi:hypothetical protein